MPTIPDPSAGGWQLNGNAKLEAPSLVLTPATANQAGQRVLADEGRPAQPGLRIHDLDRRRQRRRRPGLRDRRRHQGGADGTRRTGRRARLRGHLGLRRRVRHLAELRQPFQQLRRHQRWRRHLRRHAALADDVHAPGVLAAHRDAQGQGRHGGRRSRCGWTATKLGSVAVTLPTSAYIGFSGGTGGSTDRHAVSGFTVAGTGVKEEPKPATLKITNAISAPAGSPQAETTLTYSGTCPSSFTTAALRQRRLSHTHAHRRRPGLELLGRQSAPTGTGWKTTVSIDGAAPVELKEAGSTLTAPAFALAAGANTVAFTNTYTPPKEEPPATLKITNAISAPAGSPRPKPRSPTAAPARRASPPPRSATAATPHPR